MFRVNALAPWAVLATCVLHLPLACGDGEPTALEPRHVAAGEGGDTSAAGGAASAGASGNAAAAGVGSDFPLEPNCTPGVGELGDLKLTPVVTDLGEAVLALAPPGDARRLFVLQRTGSIRLVEDGELSPDPFLELEVQSEYAEKGLLGLAFHPEYEQNGLFYVDYVSAEAEPDTEGDVVVAEYQRDPEDPRRALPEPRRELLRLPQATAKHKAGMLAFDSAGRLYVAVGNAGDPNTSADPGQPYGKILRIDPMPDAQTYSIPGDNPLEPGWAPEVLEYGLRNPWRMSLDPCTDDIYIGDVGSEEYEEINIVPAGRHGNHFGFTEMEGYGCKLNGDPNCDQSGRVVPAGGYLHADGNCAVIGGFVYRGHAIAALRGAYLYADLCSGRIFALRYADGEVQDEWEITDLLNPERIKGFSSFGADATGELYLMSRRERAVYRIEAE